MRRTIDAVSQFARLLATAPSSTEVRDLLARSAVELIGARAAILVQLDAAGAPAIAAGCGFEGALPTALSVDTLDAQLGKAIVDGSGGRFTSAESLPLVADGGLYGVLVLLVAGGAHIDETQLQLAGAIVDIVATTLARARQIEELEHAYDELEASRQALAQAEKLRALGGMAAGISHDLKNVFAPLLLALDVLKTRKDDGDALREKLEMMRRPLENGLAIVDRLRGFSRKTGDDQRELATVAAIVNDAVDLCRPRFDAAGAAVSLAIEPGAAPPVRVEVAEATAAVTNLVVNALDSVMLRGGTVTVRTGSKSDGAFIEVEDDGPGVSAEARARLFEKFFTTKGKQGTGLGLAMVRELAQRSGGTIELDTATSGGARFTLWLPAARLA